MIFFHGKGSSFNPRIIRKNVFFSLDKTGLEIWVENSVSAIQHIEKKKTFYWSAPRARTNPFAYSCHNAQKQFIIKNLWGTTFVQTRM